MVIELSNLEVYGYCILDIAIGDKIFSREKVINEFTGFYYDGGNHFSHYIQGWSDDVLQKETISFDH